MGARPAGNQTSFRVWAPFASAVHVAGEFNDWKPDADALASEGNGFWSADVPGATEGQQYKYAISNPFTSPDVLWRKDPYSWDVTLSGTTGNSIIRSRDFDWTDEVAVTMPGYNELVIYELHIGTFNDAPGGPVGNFDSAIERLEHLVELGVNAVGLMPAKEFPGTSSWGYNVSDPFAVETDYGDLDGLKRFVKAAHNKGLIVTYDVVYNHLGPSDLDHWAFDGWGENNLGGIYFYNEDWKASTPWGHTRPDYGRGEVRQYLRDNILYWLEECRLDGVRWDATAYIRNAHGSDSPFGALPDGWSLLQWLNSEIKARQPWKISIAEDLKESDFITKPGWEGGAGFDSQWDARFVHPIRQVLAELRDEDRNMNSISAALRSKYNGRAQQRVIYTESHDEVAHENGKRRVPDQIWPGNATDWSAKKRSTLGAVMVFTAPGIPMIFQGQEVFDYRQWHDSVQMDFGFKDEFGGIFSLYRDLIRLRRNWFNNSRGLRGEHINVFHLNHADKVIAYHRWEDGGPGDDVVIVLNFSGKSYSNYRIGLPRGGFWQLRFNSDFAGYDPSFGNHPSFDCGADNSPWDGFPVSGEIQIEAYSGLIYSQ